MYLAFILATDAYCLLDVYKFIASHFQSSDYLQSFRGKRPKNLASAVARQIDENFHETNPANNNNSSSPQSSNDTIQVGEKIDPFR